ncbi:MAG TPA: ABC transporter substrate-binding protein [Acidimicrobiales bacterium]|nr:ABC transporter substrate-binding protein [Acidimicrobiales bacterium]
MRGPAVVALVMSLVLAACADDDEDEAAQETTTTAAEEPVRGGTLVAALSADPGHLNPAITTSGTTHPASEILYNGLVGVDNDLELQPELAESWEITEDGAVYTFTLRDGVTWHDGTPFTSADVKFTFDEMLLKLHGRTRASVGPALAGIETPDPQTVVFRFKAPYAPLLQQLDVTEAPILPKHKYEGTDPSQNPTNTAPVGTGPFKFVSYTKGSEIRMERNPDYFKDDLPYLDEIVIRIIPEQSAQVLALEGGEVDWISIPGGPEFSRLESAQDVEVTRTAWNPGGSNCIMTMTLNLDRPAFQDVRTRQAIAHALDRKQFLDQILFGVGKVAEAPISSGIPWAHHEDVDLPEFDRAEAERLLDEAGWTREGDGVRVASGVEGVPDGTRFAIDFLHFPTFAKYGELVRQQLGAVGIEVTQEPLEPAVFPGPVFQQRDFDTNVISYCNGSEPQIGVRRMFHSSQISPAPFTNAAGYRNAEVDRLFDEAAGEVDQAARGRIYRQIQEIVAEDQPYVWIVETEGARAYDAACTGFKFQNGLFAEAAYCRR